MPPTQRTNLPSRAAEIRLSQGHFCETRRPRGIRSMQSPSSLFIFTLGCIATLCPAATSRSAPPEERALAGRVEQLLGHVTRSKAGDIIAVDLENRAATNDDLKL